MINHVPASSAIGLMCKSYLMTCSALAEYTVTMSGTLVDRIVIVFFSFVACAPGGDSPSQRAVPAQTPKFWNSVSLNTCGEWSCS